MEKIIKVRDTLICLFHEPAKAPAGNGFINAFAIVFFVFLVFAVVMAR
ncbi:MAG: hypothetical protein WC373_07785 [Smithella sp.]